MRGSALCTSLVERGLAFEFATEHSGERSYFIQLNASVKLDEIPPRLRIRLTEVPDGDSKEPPPSPPDLARAPRRRR